MLPVLEYELAMLIYTFRVSIAVVGLFIIVKFLIKWLITGVDLIRNLNKKIK